MHHWSPRTQALVVAVCLGLALPLLGWGQATQRTDAQRTQTDVDAGLGRVHIGFAIDSLLGDLVRLRRSRGAERYYFRDPSRAGIFPEAKAARVDVFAASGVVQALAVRIEDPMGAAWLLGYLNSRYGPGVQQGRAMHFTWAGQHIQVVFDQNLLTKAATVTFQLK